MKLINNSKTQFKTSKGVFKIGSVMDFTDEEARVLLRKKKDGSPVYFGISDIKDLEVKTDPAPKAKTEFELLKEEAIELGIEFSGNVSKAKLTELVEEAKTAPDATGE